MALSLLSKNPYSTEYLDQYFHAYSIKQGLPPSLQFKISLPKNWIAQAYQASYPNKQQAIYLLAQFNNSQNLKQADPTQFIQVSCIALERELHPADWLDVWTSNQQYQALDSKTSMTSAGLVADKLMYKNIDGLNWVCRLSAIKDGEHIFLIEARIHTQDSAVYQDFQNDVFIAFSSFKLNSPSQQNYAEAFEELTLPYPQTISTILPCKWQQEAMQNLPHKTMGIKAEHKKNERSLGLMSLVNGYSDFSAKHYLELWQKQDLQEQGYQIEPNTYQILQQGETEQGLSFTISQRKATKDQQNTLILSALLQNDDASILLTMASPTAQQNKTIWAINKRAFELALNELKF